MAKLNESELSRIWHWIENADVAIITAFRSKNENCKYPQTDSDPGHEYTKRENIDRLRYLKAKLLKMRYGVTKVNGTYIERYGDISLKEVQENSLFVANIKNNPNFVDDIIKLGEEFCQDSVLISKKGLRIFIWLVQIIAIFQDTVIGLKLVQKYHLENSFNI